MRPVRFALDLRPVGRRRRLFQQLTHGEVEAKPGQLPRGGGMDAEHRRLLARATKAEDDVQLLRERLAAAYQEIPYARAQVPAKIHQVSCDAPAVSVPSDPLVRLFAALAPPRPAQK